MTSGVYGTGQYWVRWAGDGAIHTQYGTDPVELARTYARWCLDGDGTVTASQSVIRVIRDRVAIAEPARGE